MLYTDEQNDKTIPADFSITGVEDYAGNYKSGVLTFLVNNPRFRTPINIAITKALEEMEEAEGLSVLSTASRASVGESSIPKWSLYEAAMLVPSVVGKVIVREFSKLVGNSPESIMGDYFEGDADFCSSILALGADNPGKYFSNFVHSRLKSMMDELSAHYGSGFVGVKSPNHPSSDGVGAKNLMGASVVYYPISVDADRGKAVIMAQCRCVVPSEGAYVIFEWEGERSLVQIMELQRLSGLPEGDGIGCSVSNRTFSVLFEVI